MLWHADLLEEERELYPLVVRQLPSVQRQLPVQHAHAQGQPILIMKTEVKTNVRGNEVYE